MVVRYGGRNFDNKFPSKATMPEENHWSDCSTNNEPAFPNGSCDCDGYSLGEDRKMKITDEDVEAFTQYRRSQVAELRPWQPGDDMTSVSVSPEDTKAGSPKPGDMIARNPKNHADQWLVAAAYFADNFEPLAALPHLSLGAVSAKPLEWTEYETEGWADRADAEASPFGVFYNITIESDGYRVVFDHEAVGALGVFETADEAKTAAQADYERRILSALSPAPIGVTDGMVLKFITTSRDEDAGYQNWTEAVTAGLNAALASHEPAPTDTQEGLSVTGETEGLDAVDLDMIRRGDRLGPRLGETVFQALTACQQEVERLRKEIEAAKNDLRGFLTTFVHEHFPENKIWEPFPDLLGMLSQMDNASTIARDYVARIAELVKALEPFALVAEYDIGEDEGDGDIFWPMSNARYSMAGRLRVGHLRRARAALSQNGEEG